MVLVKKDHGDVIRSHIKARHKVEQQTDKHEQLLLNIAQETGVGLIFNVRHKLKVLTTSEYFEMTMSLFIIANSIVYAISDYSNVDSEGNLVSEGNLYNSVVFFSEPIFLGIFSIEMMLKMIAFGLFEKHGYLRDSWSWLDFICVIIGFISLLPSVPNLNVIRTFRCFRTLKALKTFPALKAVTSQVVGSIPKLSETLALYIFSVLFFAIVGLYSFLGPNLHSRCRYTPFPVTLDYQIGWANYSSYQCMNVPNVNLETDDLSLGKSTSPWAKPVNCWWPIDNSDTINHRFCALSNDKDIIDANNYCSSSEALPFQDRRWCGSNYDAFGNFRFKDRTLSLAEDFFSDIFYGYATFDDIFRSTVSVFIVSTANNWSFIMQNCGDSISSYVPFFFLIVLVISHFMLLSLMIATWETAVEIDDTLEIPNYFEYSVRGISIEDAKLMKQTDDEEKVSTIDNQLEVASVAGSERSNYSRISNMLTRTILQTYTASDISNYISQLGPPYSSYSHLLAKNDVDGEWLYRLNEDEILELLNEIGISKGLHQKKILASFMKLLIEIPNPNSPQSNVNKREKDVIEEEYTVLNDPNLSLYQKVLKWHYPPAKRLNTYFWYEVVVAAFCVGNLLCAISDSYPGSSQKESSIAKVNFVIVMFFLFEMTSKVLGYGLGRYIHDPFLVMDSVIVILSVIDAFTFVPVGFCVMGHCTPRSLVHESQNTSTAHASPLRGLRCIRILFLIRYLPSVRILISRIAKSIQSTIIFFILIFIFCYMMALVGTSLYANKFRFDQNGQVILTINSYEWLNSNDRPRNNFDYFLRSLATVLQLLTLDNWTDIMTSIWRSQGPTHIIFPFVVIIIGSYMLLSLYLGKLVEDFTTSAGQVEHDMKDFDSKIPPPSGAEVLASDDIEEGSPSRIAVDEKKPYYVPYFSDLIKDYRFECLTFLAVGISILTIILDSPLSDVNSPLHVRIVAAGDAMTLFFAVEAFLKIVGLGPYTYFTDIWNVFDFLVCGASLYGLYSGNAGAQALRSLRSIKLIKALRALKLLTALKGLRILIDTLSSSFGEIINVSILLLLIWGIFASIAIQYMKGELRECKGTPMTFISSNSTYMNLLQYPKSWDAFSSAEKEMFGPNSEVWSGFNTYNNDPTYSWPTYPLCSNSNALSKFPLATMEFVPPTSRQLCECWGGQWLKSTGQNFDNIAEALIVAFGVASTEGWYNTMNLVTDTNGIDMQPIRDNRGIWIMGFILFIIFGAFLPISTYVGVICSAYTNNINKNTDDAEATRTDEEREEILRTFSLSILRKNVQLYEQELEAEQLQLISESSNFRYLFTTLIFLNSILLACTWFGETEGVRDITQAANAVFSFLFTIEAVIRLRDHGWNYFQKKSNILDLTIVVLCDISDILAYTTTFSFAILKLARLFRMIKIIKLLKFDSVMKILKILIKIIPDFINVLLLLVCIVLTWAIIGNQTYALVAFQGSHDKNANFRTLPMSIMTLVKFLTGEGWNLFMYDMSMRQPGCVDVPEYDPNMCGFNDKPGCIPMNGCGNRSIFPFLMIYQILANFTILNLTISVIVNAFHHEFHQKAIMITKDCQKFCRRWLFYDPQMTCYMKPEVLENFVMDQENPYAFPPSYSMKQVRERLMHLGLKVVPGKGCLLEYVLTSLQFDYEVFGDRLSPLKKEDSINDPNTFSLMQVYRSKGIKTELMSDIQTRKLSKQKRLSIKLSVNAFETSFSKFYLSRAFLRWKLGDKFFDDDKIAGIWPRKISDTRKMFNPLDIFSTKLYENIIFPRWDTDESKKKESLSLDILEPPEYDDNFLGQSIFDTPTITSTCIPTSMKSTDSDSHLLSYINIFNPTGESVDLSSSSEYRNTSAKSQSQAQQYRTPSTKMSTSSIKSLNRNTPDRIILKRKKDKRK